VRAVRNSARSMIAAAQRVLAAAPMCLRFALPVIPGLMVALTWSVASGSADDQDACRIGAVSPEEYQAIAAEIASQPAIDWREIHRGVAGPDGRRRSRQCFVIASRRSWPRARAPIKESPLCTRSYARSAPSSCGPIWSTSTSARAGAGSLAITIASMSTGLACRAFGAPGDELTSSSSRMNRTRR
jgi:hypothetical protein